MRKFFFSLVSILLVFMLHAVGQRHALQTVDSLIAEKQYDSAKHLLDVALETGGATGDHFLIGKSHAGLGNLSLLQGGLDTALEHYLQSIKYLDAEQYPAELSKIYSNMGTLYSGLKQFDSSRKYLLKAIALNPEDNADKLKTLSNLAGVYLGTDDRASALNTFNDAVKLARKLKNTTVEAILYTNLSNYYIEGRQWPEAIKFAQQSLALRKSLGQPASAITYNNLGYATTQLGMPKQGIEYYHIALSHATLAEKKQIYYNLHQAHRALGEHQQAWQFFELYDTVKDSLTTKNYAQKVAELDAKYQSVERERHLEQLATQNTLQERQLTQQRYLIIAISMIALLITGIIYLRWKQHRVTDRLQKAEWKHRFLLLQLNPHFIFNAMQSVQHFIYKNERNKSLDYLHSFSRLVRSVLENSEEDAVSLDEEIESLTHYLHLKQLDGNASFSYTIQVDDQLDPENIWIPTLLLQPFVENAVNHGVAGRNNGTIELLFEKQSKGLDIFIKDNGKQPWRMPQVDRLHKSMGMDIVKSRIDQLNKIGRFDIAMKISQSSVVPGYEGTIVHLFIGL